MLGPCLCCGARRELARHRRVIQISRLDLAPAVRLRRQHLPLVLAGITQRENNYMLNQVAWTRAPANEHSLTRSQWQRPPSVQALRHSTAASSKVAGTAQIAAAKPHTELRANDRRRLGSDLRMKISRSPPGPSAGSPAMQRGARETTKRLGHN